MSLLRLAALAGSVTVLLSLPAAAHAQPEPLSPHAFRRLVERVGPSVLEVVSEPRGFAVLVGVGGELIADERLWGRGRLAVDYRGEKREAVLVEHDKELGLVLLRLPADDYPAASVGAAGELKKGAALVGLSFGRKGLVAEPGHFAGTRSVKGLTRLRHDVAGPPGSALFNARGQLVAVHAGRSHATVGIEELRARFAGSKGTH